MVASYRSHSSFSRVWMGATWVLALLLELLEVVPGLVEVEVAVPRLRPAVW